MKIEIGSIVKQPAQYNIDVPYEAFIPGKFPSSNIEGVTNNTQIQKLNAKADRLLGKLDGVTQILPDLDFFIFMYVRKEAALSSNIEGTQATMIDSLRAEVEITSDLPKDVERILHYIQAMNYGLKRLMELPLSLRFIKEVHRTLVKDTEDGRIATPGEFRNKQNWIGSKKIENARFVPPPPRQMMNALNDFESFLHSKDNLLPLVKTALSHAQFETIHPFIDGNGRTGRLLITFYLCQLGELEKPVLYLSEYFLRNRKDYFDSLHQYHEKGQVIPWVEFFLNGICEVSEDAIETSKKINAVRGEDLQRIQSLGRLSEKASIVLHKLYELPVVDAKKVQQYTGLTRPAANHLIKKLMSVGILSPRDVKAIYARQYVHHRYLNLFTK